MGKEQFENPRVEEENRRDDVIAGRKAVHEALKAGRAIDTVWVAKGEHGGNLPALIALCRKKDIPIKDTDSRKMDALARNHQGIIAFAACKEYATLDDLFQIAEQKGEPPFLVICDELEDPHNLGAILRTAEAAGAHGVIIPKRRSVGLSATVYKASAGAAEYMRVTRVTNLTETIKELKKRGLWVYGLDMNGENWCSADLTGAVAVVVGSEGKGISRLVREQCDGVLSLPMLGNINSLNASVACGIVLYEITRQRNHIPAKQK